MYINALKFLILFSHSSIVTEETTYSSVTAQGDNTTIQLLSGGNGYVMQDDQYLQALGPSGGGFSTSVSNQFTMGFWFYSIYPGVAKNPTTNNPESISMPIIDFVATGSSFGSLIKVREHSNTEGKNYLSITLDDGTFVGTTESNPYEPSYWHHIWVSYNGATSTINVYLDGELQTLATTGSVPSSLSGLLMEAYINHEQEGYAYNIAKNTGYIDDIFLINTVNDDVSDIQRNINYGIQYVVDDSYSAIDTIAHGIFSNDPNTITVLSSVDDASYIFVGRNDGKILRGSPLLWQVRKTYSESQEASSLNLPDGNGVDEDSGFLEINNTMIRL